MEEIIRFKGKISAWFWIAFLGVNTFLVSMMIISWQDIVGLLIGGGIFNVIWFPMIVRNYVLIGEKSLTVCFGFGSEEMELDEIREVNKSHTLLASSAASLDRIVIKSSRNELICAVCEKQRFYDELKKRNPEIEFHV